MKSSHRKYLKGLAHRIKPVVLIGRGGASPTVLQAIEAALDAHELIKIKFNAFGEKEEKEKMTAAIAQRTGAERVGSIGHTAVFFRPHPEAERRRIRLP